MINDIIGKVINVARCFVENFVAAIIVQLIIFITQFVNSIFSTVNNFISGTFGIVNSGLGIVSMSLVFFKTFFHFSVVKMMLIVLSGRR